MCLFVFFVAITIMKLNSLKICGISDPDTALFCAEQGAGAIGVVFFPKSPRNVSAQQAAEVLAPLPEGVAKVGVFVNMPIEKLLQTAKTAKLTTIQMHGHESNDDIERALHSGYRVIKVLKSSGEQLLKDADNLPPKSGVMVELSQGILPGGNGAAWNWTKASILNGKHSFALAGGLTAKNLQEAAMASCATAFDLSSAVENAPGVKDRNKIIELINVAENLNLNTIFWR